MDKNINCFVVINNNDLKKKTARVVKKATREAAVEL